MGWEWSGSERPGGDRHRESRFGEGIGNGPLPYLFGSVMAKTIVHVHQAIIKRNHKTGERQPPLTVKSGKSNVKAHEVEIKGPC